MKKIITKYINKNKRIFDKNILVAEKAIKYGFDQLGITIIQSVAHFAWLNFTGEYRNPQIENLISIVSKRRISDKCIKNNEHYNHRKKDGVLHVITKAPSFGGCPQFVFNWIKNDENNIHSIFVTQSSIVTTQLKEAAIESNGNVYFGKTNFINTAQYLRDVSHNYQIVVLHIHPYDIVPNLSFSVKCSSKIIYNNHADHVFWIGADVADIVANLRKSGESISINKRFIDKKRVHMLPIPLSLPYTPINNEYNEAREEIGIESDEILAISIASEYKFSKISMLDFISDHIRILSKNNKLKIIVIGPRMTRRWKTAYAATQGRLKAIGPTKNLGLFRDGADIFIDSYPFSSLTSMLESLLYKREAISLKLFDETDISRFDDISLEGDLGISVFKKDYDDEFNKIIERSKFENSIRERRFQSILSNHFGDGWLKHCQSLYNKNIDFQRKDICSNSPQLSLSEFELILFETQKAGNESYGLALCLFYELLKIRNPITSLCIFSLFIKNLLMNPLQIISGIVYISKKHTLSK